MLSTRRCRQRGCTMPPARSLIVLVLLLLPSSAHAQSSEDLPLDQARAMPLDQARALLALQHAPWQAAAAVKRPVCYWPGVSCGFQDNKFDVVSVHLQSCEPVHGDRTLPAAWATALPQLYEIDLRECGVSGVLPDAWAGLGLDTLSLHGNRINGSLPAAWGAGSRLSASAMFLDLSGNPLDGEIPATWGRAFPRLEKLDLANTFVCGRLPSDWYPRFTGATMQFNLPAGMIHNTSAQARALLRFNYSQWQTAAAFNVSPCGWEGVQCARGSITKLAVRCSLNASVSQSLVLPPKPDALEKLRDVRISGCGMRGQLPEQWARLPLEFIDLSDNMLSGTLPAAWANSSIYTLDLSGNRLAGPLPATWKSLGLLFHLNVSRNALNGSLPGEWGSGLPELKKLDAAANRLSGPLPQQWLAGLLSHLKRLNLDGQQGGGFVGSVPEAWRQLCLVPGKELTWAGGDVVPSGLVSFSSGAGQAMQASWLDWRHNLCLYAYGREGILAVLVLFPALTGLAVLAGCIWRSRRPAARARAWPPHLWWLSSVAAVWKPVLWPAAKMAVVSADIITDAMTIKQVWPSWVGTALLTVVFLPELLTCLCLAACTAHVARCLESAPPQPQLPQRPGCPLGWAWLGWVEAVLAHPTRLLEWALLRVCHACRGSTAWRIACGVCACPVLVVAVPLLVPLGMSEKGAAHLFTVWRPDRVGMLWGWCAATIEAPVALGLLSMLLLVGVQPENHYVITEVGFLAASLAFTVAHLLGWVCELVLLTVTAHSWPHWLRRMSRPFVLAVPRDL